jgi:hypothetical protein
MENSTDFIGNVVRQMEFVINGPEIFNYTDTIKSWSDNKESMKAVIKIRHSPYMKDLLEFTVELNGIPVLGDA